MTKKPSPLQAARTRVATELGLPEDDWPVIRLAALQVAYDGVQATLATGNPRDADVDALLKLDMQIEAVRKEAGLSVKPLAIKVTYVSPNTRCPKCDHAFNLDLPADDDNGSKVQAANAKPLPGDPYVVAKPADPTPPKAPGSIVAAVPGGAAMSRPQNVVSHDSGNSAARRFLTCPARTSWPSTYRHNIDQSNGLLRSASRLVRCAS